MVKLPSYDGGVALPTPNETSAGSQIISPCFHTITVSYPDFATIKPFGAI